MIRTYQPKKRQRAKEHGLLLPVSCRKKQKGRKELSA